MVVVAILVAVLFLLLVTEYYGSRVYQRAALVAFSGHLFVSLAIIPRLPYTWDIGKFHRRAVEISTGSFDGGSSTVSSFGAFQGLLYAIFTPDPGTLAVFNSVLAVLVAIPAAYLATSLYSRIDQNFPTVIVAILFWPLPFLFLSIPMRDALAVLIFFTLLATLLHAFREKTPSRGLPAIPLWGMCFLLRPELALIVVLGSVAAVVVGLLRIVSPTISLPPLAVVLGAIGGLGFGLFAELLYSFEGVNAALASRSIGGAVYLDGMAYRSWSDFLLAAPARAIYFQFAPFPLHVESAFHLLAFLGTLLIVLLFVSAVRSLSDCEFNEVTAVFLGVIYLAGIVGYGAINSNFGTNVRHRIVFDFLLIVFASPVLRRWWLRLCSRIGNVPGHDDEHNEQHDEAQEFDRFIHRRREDADDTQQ